MVIKKKKKRGGGREKCDSRVSPRRWKTPRTVGKNQKRDKRVQFSRVNSADNQEAISGLSK